MEEREITPSESVAIITRMIEESRQRIAQPDLRASVMWGLVTVVSALLVLILLLTMKDPVVNYVWFAIPVIGIPLNILMTRGRQRPVSSYVDRIVRSIWRWVAIVAFVCTAMCVGFNIAGMPQAWLVMLFYAFVIVGFGALCNGIILREVSYKVGGVVSILSGGFVAAMAVCGVPLRVAWVLPLYIVCFLAMFIVPAWCITRKMKSRNERA